MDASVVTQHKELGAENVKRKKMYDEEGLKAEIASEAIAQAA